MKNILKVICTIVIILIILGFVFYCIDSNKVSKKQKPILSLDESGGSIILYFGLGYTIYGDYTDGGWDNVKFDTWIGWFLKAAV